MSDPVRRPPMPTINRSNLSSKFGSGAFVTHSFAQRNQDRIMKAARLNQDRMAKAVQQRRDLKQASELTDDASLKTALEEKGEQVGRQIGRLQMEQKQD